MKAPHKHAEIIKAWADGKDVQVRHSEREGWIDMVWLPHDAPVYLFAEYKVKPDYPTRYRLYLNRGDNRLHVCTDPDWIPHPTEDGLIFKEFVTEWLEIGMTPVQCECAENINARTDDTRAQQGDTNILSQTLSEMVVSGMVEIATREEMEAGTDVSRIIDPLKLATKEASEPSEDNWIINGMEERRKDWRYRDYGMGSK